MRILTGKAPDKRLRSFKSARAAGGSEKDAVKGNSPSGKISNKKDRHEVLKR
jgi:hypothetical protein